MDYYFGIAIGMILTLVGTALVEALLEVYDGEDEK